MSAAKHTRGPWFASLPAPPKYTPGPWHASADDCSSWRIRSVDQLWIASIHEDAEIATDLGILEELEANARLIAAAPDLLKALNDIWSAADADVTGDPLFIEIRDLAAAAIAKAEGGAA